MKYQVGDKILIDYTHPATVDTVDENGAVVHASLWSGAKWWRPKHIRPHDGDSE